MMASWGACHVAAVDISQEAIGHAKIQFQHDKIDFYCHDAESVDELFSDDVKFDIIACFETIEHLKNPERFLRAIKKVATDNAIIVISCPNDKDEAGSNPFHLGSYTFDEFKSLTTNHLGSDAQWMMGTPANGMVNIAFDAAEEKPADVTYKDIVRASKAGGTLLLPPQNNVVPNLTNCLYFVGIWGDRTDLSDTVCVSPLSYTGFIAPWGLIEHNKIRVSELEKRVKVLEKSLLREKTEINEYKKRVVDLSTELLNLRNTHRNDIQIFEASANELNLIKRSRIHRTAVAYYSLYHHRVFGPPLQIIRKVARRTLSRT
jgi:SAM-dependent methyltransferase